MIWLYDHAARQRYTALEKVAREGGGYFDFMAELHGISWQEAMAWFPKENGYAGVLAYLEDSRALCNARLAYLNSVNWVDSSNETSHSQSTALDAATQQKEQ